MEAMLKDRNTISCKYGDYHIDDETFKSYEYALTDTTKRYKIRIVHNYCHKAMLDIVERANGKHELRIEVNTIEFKDDNKWIVDQNYEKFNYVKSKKA